jgi:hypothetical protein
VGLAGVLALAACGSGAGENKAKAKANSLEPGQYEVTAEVTSFRAADNGPPKINTPQGTSTTRSVCVTDGAKLPPDLFADEGITCRPPNDTFASGGIVNMNLQCQRAGLTGEVGYAVEGTFEAQSFEAQRRLATRLEGEGDVVIAATVRGRRTGACAAPAASPGPGSAGKGAK